MPDTEEGDMPIDPVCGMEVSEEGARGRVEYQGKTYYFCSDGCREEFGEDPEYYLEDRGPERREKAA